MNAGSIWWGQVGTSLRLLRKLTNDLQDCRSVILQIPAKFPWRQAFYDAVDVRRTAFGGERRLIRLPWEEGTDPGEFVLRELCSQRVRADYFPVETCAAYLGGRDDLLLNEYYVWITGIRSHTDLSHWAEFVTQYEQAAQHAEQHAVFVLEYTGTAPDFCGMEKTIFTIESCDCRVFCLETAAALHNTQLRRYQAELALTIAGDDPEFAAALLETGNRLVQEPVETVLQVCAQQRADDGRSFPALTEKKILSAVWEAAVVLFFPLLERCRMDMIERYHDVLLSHLPIPNSNGDQIEDPQDLEIGTLFYIAGSDRIFHPEDLARLRLCRKVRNTLAHNRPLSCDEIHCLQQLEQARLGT